MEKRLNGFDKILKKIRLSIESLIKEKFTGEVVFRLKFNQGGIRDSKITLDKSL